MIANRSTENAVYFNTTCESPQRGHLAYLVGGLLT